jgi:hypothetical protein
MQATVFCQEASRTSLGGYGELHYNEPDGIQRGELDFHRFVLYLGHTFTDQLSFHSELEIEHTSLAAGEETGGEVALEQAFLDYRLHESLGIRAGLLLVPVGILNMYHEPPTFHGVERPNVERLIIPTTWREGGAGIYGAPADGLAYQLYLVAGLRASGFSASSGLRGGRQSGFRSDISDPSVTGRIDLTPAGGLRLGASFFVGNSTGGVDSLGQGRVTFWSADVQYSSGGLVVRALAALATLSDTRQINREYGGRVADRITGWYTEAGYDILPWLAPDTDQELSVFARYERYNTQASTDGFAPLEQYNRNDIVLGLTYRPAPSVAFKTDYTWLRNSLNSGAARNTGQFNLGLGYYFF